MRNLLSLLLILVVGSMGYAQETDVDEKEILVTNLEEVTVSSGVIDVAVERKTPIALSIITSQEVQLKVGNLEFPRNHEQNTWCLCYKTRWWIW